MASRGKRDRGKEQFWRRMQRQWQRSGLSVRAFSAEHGLAEASFYAWRRILAQRDRQSACDCNNETGANNTPAFVPLRVIDASAPTALEVVLERGQIVRVLRGFDAATLRQLLAILEEERPC